MKEHLNKDHPNYKEIMKILDEDKPLKLKTEQDIYQYGMSRGTKADLYEIRNKAEAIEERLWAQNSVFLEGSESDIAQRVISPSDKVRKFNKIRDFKLENIDDIDIQDEISFMQENDNIADHGVDVLNANAYGDAERIEFEEVINEVISELTSREQKVLKMRFGLDNTDELTLDEVGTTFGVNRERIRQIEAKALRKLRHPSRSDELRAFLSWKDDWRNETVNLGDRKGYFEQKRVDEAKELKAKEESKKSAPVTVYSDNRWPQDENIGRNWEGVNKVQKSQPEALSNEKNKESEEILGINQEFKDKLSEIKAIILEKEIMLSISSSSGLNETEFNKKLSEFEFLCHKNDFDFDYLVNSTTENAKQAIDNHKIIDGLITIENWENENLGDSSVVDRNKWTFRDKYDDYTKVKNIIESSLSNDKELEQESDKPLLSNLKSPTLPSSIRKDIDSKKTIDLDEVITAF